MGLSETLPHDEEFYDRQAQNEEAVLLGNAARLRARGMREDDDHTLDTHVQRPRHCARDLQN